MGHLILAGKFNSWQFFSNHLSTDFKFTDGTRYDGAFLNGLCNGLGVMTFSDGAK